MSETAVGGAQGRARSGGHRPARTPVAGARRPGDVIGTVLRGLGEVLITLGVIILLFVVYELYFTGIATAHAQSRLNRQFQHQLKAGIAPSATPRLGTAVALMYAPRLGSRTGWHFAVLEGANESQLAQGPGHYEYPAALAQSLGISKPLADGDTASAFPGQVGNFVVSGHRTTHAHPFFDADKFQAGDAVIFETTTAWYVYRVTGSSSVLPDDVGVTFPVPDKQHGTPTQRLLTLTTCNPKYSASHRLVIRGVLAYTQPLSAGDPAAFRTGKA